MSITEFFKRQTDVFVSIDTEGAWRRDAGPFVSFDTDVPKVAPLSDGPRYEIFERDINREPALEIKTVKKTRVAKEVEITWEFETPEMLLLVAPKAQKLLMAGKSPLLLGMPEVTEQSLSEILEARHVIYFSDVEFKDGVETITGAKVEREKQRSFIGAKVMAFLFMMTGLVSILFPSASLKASKIEYTVNPTNTTPGLSFAISSNDLVAQETKGALTIQTQENQLVTSTLDLDVSTTGADGYKMYVTTTGTDKKGNYTSALVNKDINANNGEGAKINSLSSDTAMSAFPAGYWGYATDSSLQSSTLFKPFPIYDATDTTKYGGDEIASSNTAVADADAAGETPFTIGIKTDNNMPSGEYENELLFTVIVNPVILTYNLNFDGNTDDSSLADMPATVTETSSEVFKDMTIPANEPTRDSYVFAGWAESAGGSVVYHPGDDVTVAMTESINVTQTINKTLYAVWDSKEYLQDFDGENELQNPGDSKTLYDQRDGEAYTVKRLADGKVWMTQNLRYATGAYVMSDNAEYGGYYSYNTALNVCPAGWHLPTSSEHVALDVSYGFSGEGRTDAAADVDKYKRTDGDWPGYVTAGYYNDATSATATVGVALTYWSSTADANNVNNALYTTTDGATGTKFYPASSNRKTLGFSVRCVAGEEPKKYLQDFNDAIDLRTVGDSDTYVDKRDGAEYTVKRLPDGKVWMTQNLRYVGTTTDPGTDSVTSGSFTTTTELSQGAATINMVNTFTRSNYTSYEAKYNGDTTYGAYYTWNAALNVCPSGWHLPSGGTSTETSEFAKLLTSYGYPTKATNTTYVSNFLRTDGNWPGFVLAGQYYHDNATNLDGAGTQGSWWSSTAHGSNANTVYDLILNTSGRFDAQDSSYSYGGWTVRCVGDQPNVFFIQDFDESSMLPNTGDSAILTDKRDQSTYTVKRLPDGKVWMTQNLRYMGTSSDPGTTSITSGSFTTAAESEKAGVSISAGLSPIYSTSQTGAYYAGNTSYGAYYDWTAAHAVCPKGWHLTTVAESVALDKAYGYTGTNRDSRSNGGHGSTYYPLSTMQAQATNYRSTSGNWPGITLNGEVFQGSLTGVGGISMLWLADGDGYNSNVFFHINVSSSSIALIYPNYNDMLIKTYGDIGVGVRCVADEDAKISFDANGGTGTMEAQSFTKGARQTLSTNVFTRPGYTFLGWALTPSATTAKYTDGQAAVFNKSTVLYAVWEANYMQNFDAKNKLKNVGDSMTLIDSRDDNTYTVKRLPDGKLWMTQNMRNTTNAYSVSDNPEYGAYYIFTVAKSICPTGWHLPSGGDDGEFAKLDIAYGGSGLRRTDAEMAANYHTNTGNWPNVALNGKYPSSGGALQVAGAEAYLWSKDRKDGSYVWAFSSGDGSSIKTVIPNDYTSAYAIGVRCIANETETVSFDANGGTGKTASKSVDKGGSVTLKNKFTRAAYNFIGWSEDPSATTATYTDNQGIVLTDDLKLYAIWEPVGDFIQDFDQDTELLSAGSSKTLYDNRDGESYTVKRLADGKVWMTQNLRYADGATTMSDNSSYGGYYTWNVAQSVCPTGWHLPKGGTDGEFVKLDIAYGGTGLNRDSANTFTSFRDTAGFVFAGAIPAGDTAPSNAGLVSSYWSDTLVEGNNSKAYKLRFNTSLARVYPQDTDVTTEWSASVRCVADYEEKTVSFNANGGTGSIANQTIVKGQSVTLPTNTMTRTYYNFLGWSESSNATTATYADGATIAVADDMTLYAVWQPIAMQSFNKNTMLTTKGTQTELRDSRDGKIYTVARLNDNKVWMTKNLAYADGAFYISSNEDYGGYYLRSDANNVCPAGWRLPTTADYTNLDVAYGGAGGGKQANASSRINSVYLNSILNYKLAGMYRTVDTKYGKKGLDSEGTGAYYLQSDTNATYVNNIMGVNINTSLGQIWMDANTFGNTYALAVRCIAN